MAPLKFGTYLILICVLAANTEEQTLPPDDYFSVKTGLWGECRRINESSSCYRTRNASCVRTWDAAIAPWYYCEQNDLQRVPEVELCAPESCAQDCVVSVWSEWSECNCSASNYRSRWRDIVVPPRNGGAECPQLLQNDTCSCGDTIDYLPRNYTWKLGKWGECGSALSTRSQQPYQCGHGLRNRSVQCVDLGDFAVGDSYCLLEDAYSHVLPPVMSELCEIPCLCALGRDWSDWGECTPVCDTPIPYAEQRRERAVLQLPTSPGSCEEIETRRCVFDPATCPQHAWNTSDWSGCSYDDGRSCGTGLTERYVYCLKTLAGETRSVSLEECEQHLNDPRPSNLDICETPCPQNCFVGRWSAWSSCPVSCNVTYSNRTRSVLIEPQGDGADCPHLIEYGPCPVLPCAQWITGEFSTCFPTSGSCGNGTKTRNVYCGDPSGMGIDYDKCTHLPQPGRSDFCYKPCANDCVISDWSPWSRCHQDCGTGNGVQTRTRRLLAYGTNPCLYETANLKETRSCISDTPCSDTVYHIQSSEWSDCAIIPLDASGDAPPTLLTQEPNTCEVGIQTRTAVCVKNGQVIAEDECPFAFRAHVSRRCNVSCSKGCIISEWDDFSTCSVSCGDGYKSRSRRLLQFPNPPDSSCSADLNSRGIETETIPCHMPACPAENTWFSQPWSECVTHPTVLSRLPLDSVTVRELGSRNQQCGFGYQNRSVVCVDERRNILPDSSCLHLLDEKPTTLQSCVVPCVGKCIVTPWSEFGVCTDGVLFRSREIIPFEGSSDWLHDCPELVDVPTEDTVPCLGDDTGYGWAPTSRWGECVLEAPDAMCGSGFEYRSIACVDVTPGYVPERPVSEELCLQQVGPMPSSKRSCTLLCERDCILSDWSEFSECNVTSGHGYKSRTREITQSPQEGGRECGPLVEYSICYVPPNEVSHRYVVTTYGCLSVNASAVCGEGYEMRELVCLVNGVEQPDTTACSHNPPFRNHSCTLPCPGECVVSTWGPYSDCPDVCPADQICHQTRFREVVREGTDCPRLVQNRRCSQLANPYTWRTHQWQNCKVNVPGSVTYCGNGLQERIVECVNVLTNEMAFEEQCGDSERPAEIRACEVPCPVDCQVSSFSTWSECPSTCVFSPMQTRERTELVQSRNGGRECPSPNQQRSCILRNCDVYIFQGYESRCSPVYTVNSTCGSVPSAAPASCLKNNRFVNVRECLNANASGFEVTSIDVQSRLEDYCNLECPLEPECAWSEWSECQTLCLQPGDEEFSFRDRKLLKAHEKSREQCLRLQHEPCIPEPPVDSENETLVATTIPPTCIGFNWQTSVWNSDGTRTVWCQSSTGIEVASGCVESLRPVERNGTCQSTCDEDRFFYCDVSSGNCACSPPLYEPASDYCLPLSGCALDSHCLYPDMVCDTQTRTCICRARTRLDNGVCVPIPTTEPTTPPTDPTTVTNTMATSSAPSTTPPTSDATTAPDTDPTDKEPTTEPTTAPQTTEPDSEATTEPSTSVGLGILPIILISVVPLIVVIIIILMLIAIIYRCRKQLEEKHKRERSERKNRITISEPMPLTRLNNESADEDRTGTLRRGADSASSGFVEDLEHDVYKYGMAGRTFNEPTSQTMQTLDIDEAAIRHNAQQYLPQHAQQFMPEGTQPYIPQHQQYLPEHPQHYDHVPYEYGAPSSIRSHTPSPLPMAELQSYHRGNMHMDGHGRRGFEHQAMGGMISGSEESRISRSSSSHYGRSGEFAYRGVDNYDYLPPARHITQHPAHMPSAYRDDRIATGLDGPMVRAIEQLTGPGGPRDGSRSPSISSRSSGRASGRGSRRRRHPRDRGPGVRIQHPTYPGPYPNSPPIASPITPLSPSGTGSDPRMNPSPYSPRVFVYPSSSSPYHSTVTPAHSSSSNPYHSTASPVHPTSPQLNARHIQRAPQNIYISNPLSGMASPVQPPSPSVTAQHSPSNPHTHTTTPPAPPPPPPVRNESLGASSAQTPSNHLTPPSAASSVRGHTPPTPRQPSPLVHVRHAFRDSSDYELELPQTFTVTPPSSARAVTSRGAQNSVWNQQHNQA